MPAPIILNLSDAHGFYLRQQAAAYLADNENVTGAERGSSEEQGFGALAEIVCRDQLSLKTGHH